ncbi:B12-binding domain-containing radical SAM protein [Fibrobacterota bacterium]
MEIMLIEPPAVSRYGNQRIFGGNGSNKSDFKKPPLDLMMISGYLRKCGYDNELLDANASRRSLDDVRAIMEEKKPDLVLFSTSTCTICMDLLIAETAKKINPETVTVALGTHGMALPEETLNESEFLDVVIYTGEWEAAALNIVENIADLNGARGIYFKDSNGKILKTDAQPTMENLDDLGFPSHDKLEKRLYGDPASKRFPKTMVMGQKACINNCSFCCQPAFFGAPQIRLRSVSHFLEELQWVQSLGFKEVMFNDATITADRTWATELFNGMIERNIDLTWNCSTRVDCVDDEILELMKKAGCQVIAIGMESVDKTVLKNIRKNVSPEKVRKAINMIRKNGMESVVFCVIGFPGETKDSIRETISFLKTLNTTYTTLGIAVPAPGTDFYRYVEEKGFLHTRDWSQYDPMKKPVFSYPDLSADEIEYYSRYGLRQFYLRPSYIMKRLVSIRNPDEFFTYVKNFFGFLRRYSFKRS